MAPLKESLDQFNKEVRLTLTQAKLPTKNLWVIVFTSGHPLQLQLLVWRTQQSRLLDDGRAHHAFCILDGNQNG